MFIINYRCKNIMRFVLLINFLFLYISFSEAIANEKAQPKALTYGNKPIEAYCIAKILGGTDDDRVDLRQCYKEIIKEKIERQPVNTDVPSGFQGYDYKKEYCCESMYWQYLGSPWLNHFLIYSFYSGGGSGNFTSISMLKREGDILIKERVLDDGDRAMGGISEPILNASKLTYYKSISMQDFFLLGLHHLGNEWESYKRDEKESINSLPFCAACSFAEVGYLIDFSAQNPEAKMINVILPQNDESFQEKDQQEEVEEKSLQECILSVVQQYNAAGMNQMTQDQFKEFTQNVISVFSKNTSKSNIAVLQ